VSGTTGSETPGTGATGSETTGTTGNTGNGGRIRLLRAAGAWRAGGLLVIAALFAVFPLVVTNGLVTTIGVDAMIFIAAAAAWNIFSGYSGYISLGHAVFFGCGAYTVAIGARDWHLSGDAVFALLPLAAVVGAVVAVPLGLVALRVRRHTFVVITIAFFFIFQLMAANFSFTAGSTGIIAPILNWDPATYNNPFYYLALGIAAATTALSWLIRGSRFGLQLRAIRDDEDRARGLGVRAMRVKLAAFVISAFITGLVGGLWSYFVGEALPQFAFDPLFDLSVALMSFLGGLGTVAGPVLGALIIEPAQQYLTTTITNDYLSLILLGALFLAVILLLPRGVIPTAGEMISKWQARRRGRASSAAPPPAAGPGPATAPARRATAESAGKDSQP
jgi:branched-chain amino acid transport system permease protein